MFVKDSAGLVSTCCEGKPGIPRLRGQPVGDGGFWGVDSRECSATGWGWRIQKANSNRGCLGDVHKPVLYGG